MYSLDGYGTMIKDQLRVDAYTQALRKTVFPGSVVVEIGTGPGVFAVLACKLGAKRVYAIEADGIIQVAREVAAANHVADKIEFIEDISTAVTLPERADVVVGDLHGVLPFHEKLIPSFVDARRRLLVPGGKLIPRLETIWVALVEAAEPYRKLAEPWANNALTLDLSPGLALAVNTIDKVLVKREHLLTEPKLWATLDYATIEDPDVCGSLQFTVQRAGTAHGFVVWFDAELADGAGFSNAPGAPELIYGSMFFPWVHPVEVAAGQSIGVELEAKLLEHNYTWRWETRIESSDGSGHAAVCFKQSEFAGTVLSAAVLRTTAANHVPQLSEKGHLHYRTLQLMDGKTSLESIARRLAAEFPGLFTRWEQALSHVSKVSRQQ